MIVILFASYTAYAQTDIQLDILKAEEYIAEIGEEFEDVVPNAAKEYIYDSNINYSITEIINMHPMEMISFAWDVVLDELNKPLQILTSIVAIVILCMFAECLSSGYMSENLSWVFTVICILCCASAIVEPVVDCIKLASSTIADSSNFMLSLIPVLSGIMTAGGQGISGAAYGTILFFVCQIMSIIAQSFFVPFLGTFLAISIVGNTVPGYLSLSKVSQSIKKVIQWSLGFVMSILLGFLTIQTLVGSSADSVTAKTTKFVIGSFVPVIGSALSDAFMATRGYIGIVKSTIGAFGIFIAVITFLPIIVRVVIWYVTVSIASYLGEVLRINQLPQTLSSIATVLGVLISILLCIILLITVSTAIVIMTSMGAV